MGILIVHPESEEKLVAFEEEQKSPYDSAFVEKITRSNEDFKAGKSKAIKTDDLWK